MLTLNPHKQHMSMPNQLENINHEIIIKEDFVNWVISSFWKFEEIDSLGINNLLLIRN